jgi:transposase
MAMHVDSGSLVTPDQYSSRVLNHLGLVAGMYDELGVGEVIDQVIVQDMERRHVSLAQAVKAMVLNGLGFTQRALYLTPQFFQDKPVERLIGPGVDAAQLNDDVLGRTLDALYDYGVTSLYSQLAAQAVSRLGLSSRFGHLDSTSFHVDGDYASDAQDEAGVVRLTRGYSRDHRPDLNQVVLQLIVERQAALPVLMQPLSGNSSDKTSFREAINTHINQLRSDVRLEYVVADSALYASETLQALDQQQVGWISRVPNTLTLAQQILDTVAPELISPPQRQAMRSLGTVYAHIKQRWLVVYSPEAHQRALHTLNQQYLSGSRAELTKADKLARRVFACEADAQQALSAFEKGLKYTMVAQHRILTRARYRTTGRPAHDQLPAGYDYHLELNLACRPEQHHQRVWRKSCFILATNQTDTEALTDDELLAAYKDQQNVERGFRFFKDPQFMAATLFLKSPQRIMALMMIMTLCLMVYAALEYRIRQALADHECVFPNQKNQPTTTPTARWVFHYFTGIHLLIIAQLNSLVLNLNEHHIALLTLLGERYERLYAPDG